MNMFERYLTLWVGVCILVGIGLGQFFPGFFAQIGGLEIASINLPVAALIWVMILPMLMRIDFKSLAQIGQYWRGICVTLAVNWLIKPFSMALLGWLFLAQIFAPLLPADQIGSYQAGLILLAAAPCTAMVFVWSKLTNGNGLFTLTQVALNDVIMVFAFAPLVALLLGVSAVIVPWQTLVVSVLGYIVVPVLLAQWLRHIALGKAGRLDKWLSAAGPYSMAALLLTLVLLFAFQGEQVLAKPLIIALIAVPILVQVFLNAAIAYFANRAMGECHEVACPSALIGASNFFELAVATSIALFGLSSGAALATVVGVLVEVPAMLAVVWAVNRSKSWYQAK